MHNNNLEATLVRTGMNRFAAILIILLMQVQAFAQNGAKIGGTVRNEAGNPIELVSVRIAGTMIGCATNLRGHYSLRCSNQDSITLIFSMIGYETQKRMLVKPKGNISLNITLHRSTVGLDEVSVVGQRRQLSTVQNIKPATSQLPDASGGNGVESLIATQAGVNVNNELSSKYSVRGGNYDENLVYVNGVEIYHPMLIRQGQQEGLSLVNPDMIENIRFSTGGFDATYGDKMSSVLDIDYRRPHKTEGHAAINLMGASAYLGFGNEHFSWTNAIRYKTNKYLLGTLDTQAEYQPQDIDYQTYLTWVIHPHWQISVLGDVMDNHFNFSPQDRYTSYGTVADARRFKVYYEGDERDYFQTVQGAFTTTYKPNNKNEISFQLSAYHAKEQISYDITSEYWLSALEDGGTTILEDENSIVGLERQYADNKMTANVINASLRGIHRKAGNLLKWGLELHHEQVKETTDEWNSRDTITIKNIESFADRKKVVYQLAGQNEEQSLRVGAYVQHTHRFELNGGILSTNMGIRSSYWNWNKEWLISPRFSLGFVPENNEHLTLRFATGVYYQTPFFKEMREESTVTNEVTMNHDIKSQRSIQFVLGGDYTFRAIRRAFRFTAEAYYKHLTNLIPYEVDNIAITYSGQNSAKGYATGLDMKLFGEFVEGTDSWFTLSLLKTAEKVNGQWLPRPTDQRYRMNLVLTDNFPGIDRFLLTFKGSLAGSLPFGPKQGGRSVAVYRSSPYRRIDLGMSYFLVDRRKNYEGKGLKDVVAGIEVFNLFNTQNVGSYYWLTDLTNNQHAIPCYLTSRRLNISLQIHF